MFISLNLQVARTETGLVVAIRNDEGCTGVTTLALPTEPGDDVSTTVVLTAPKAPKDHNKAKRRKQISKKQEEKLAEVHGGIRHNGSGNQPGYEGDVRVPGVYRMEAKFTASSSYRITRAELNKIRSECALGESPIFVIDFKEKDTLRTEDSWVLVPSSVWEKHAKTSNDR